MPRIQHSITEENSVDLSAYAAAIALDKVYGEQIKEIEAKRAEVRTAIEAAMGNKEYAVVNGEPVMQRRATTRYSEVRLQREHSDLVEPYRREVIVEKFDMALFAMAYPKIADEYRVVQLVNL